MIRVLFLVICLASAAIGGVYDSKPVPQRKRHTVTDFIYPYFEVMAGVEKITTKIKTESYTHWYHDKKLDEMVYDEDLYYDIYSFNGAGPNIEAKLGVQLIKHVAFFLNLGLAWPIGSSHYKYYSLDKEEYIDRGYIYQPFFGVGTKVYPFVQWLPILDGLFIGASLIRTYANGSWEDYGMTYDNHEDGYKLEAGHLWNITGHYFIGITANMASYSCSTSDAYSHNAFGIGWNPTRPPDESKTKVYGISLTVVFK